MVAAARLRVRLALVGNLELVTGRLPGDGAGGATPSILIEVAHLEQVREAALTWLATASDVQGTISWR